MRVAMFNTKPYEEAAFRHYNERYEHNIEYIDVHLTSKTVALANGFPAVCAFVNDDLSAQVLESLHSGGTRLVALRSAGFNHVDLEVAQELGLTVVRVPAYSPHAVAEHTIGLILALNRKYHRAYQRVREGNFSLQGLMGFDLFGKTAGVVGTGKIGTVAARILNGFGMRVLAYDTQKNSECEEMGVEYVSFEDLLRQSDVLSLHCPLTTESHHLIDDAAIALMKPGVLLVNTSRGALIDTHALIKGLKEKHIGSVGLDVYEEEEEIFFEDLSDSIIQDDAFSRLLTFPNVLITSHQAFFTKEAVDTIADTTLKNVHEFEHNAVCQNVVKV